MVWINHAVVLRRGHANRYAAVDNVFTSTRSSGTDVQHDVAPGNCTSGDTGIFMMAAWRQCQAWDVCAVLSPATYVGNPMQLQRSHHDDWCLSHIITECWEGRSSAKSITQQGLAESILCRVPYLWCPLARQSQNIVRLQACWHAQYTGLCS